MRKLSVILIMVLLSTSLVGQDFKARAISISISPTTEEGFSPMQSIDELILFSDGKVEVYGQVPQTYYIRHKHEPFETEGGFNVLPMLFIDQDGDPGVLMLIEKDNSYMLQISFIEYAVRILYTLKIIG